MTRYLSVCSGIEAATVAWHPLGWQAAGFAEVDPFASRVLHHHYSSGRPRVMPDPAAPGLSAKERRHRRVMARAVTVLPDRSNGPPNFGDFTAIDLKDLGPVDVLVGGTPCQAFSVAGKRLSLADARGNLSLAYTVLAHALADRHGLRWAVWENVPGVLNTPDNAFGCFLGSLVGAGSALDLPAGAGGWTDAGLVAGPRARAAWRILDAQYFGLAQRRRRVFVVAGFAAGTDPAAVLLERQGLRRHPPARGQAGQDVAATLGASLRNGGGVNPDGTDLIEYGGNNTAGPIDVATALTAHGGASGRQDFDSETFVACEVADTLTVGANQGTGFFGDCVAHALRGEGFDASEDGSGRGTPLVAHAFDARQSDVLQYGDIAGPVDAGQPGASALIGRVVRRLMPVETERLQGFPDGYTALTGAADGPRYKTHGNSMAVPVMAWIGRRIAAADRSASPMPFQGDRQG